MQDITIIHKALEVLIEHEESMDIKDLHATLSKKTHLQYTPLELALLLVRNQIGIYDPDDNAVYTRNRYYQLIQEEAQINTYRAHP